MKNSKDTKKYIIEKVAPVFNKKGFTGTYLSDLEKATGLTKGSIYGNFKNKNEVALEAFRHNYKQLSKKIKLRMEQSKTSKEKIGQFIEFYEDEYENIIHNGGCPILNTAVDADDGNEILKTAVQKAIVNWIELIEDILREGVANNEFKNIDTYKFSVKIISIIEGSIMLAKALDDKNIIQHNLENLKAEINNISK